MGEGNDFHSLLIAPAQERLLDLRAGESVLDVACGNGQFARRMAQLGARVVGVDVAARMIDIAKASSAGIGGLEFHAIDATDPAALTSLGRGRFDAAVCTMALMDIASIDPLMASVADVLRPDGRFVFSVVHPCFNASGVRLVAEEMTTEAGDLVRRYGVAVSQYIRSQPAKGVAMRAQPVAQYYFDRPISALLGSGFKAGFVLDGLEEPTFPTSADDGRANWANITEIPPALVARMRPSRSASR